MGEELDTTADPDEPFDPDEAPHEGEPPEGYETWGEFFSERDWSTWAEFYDWAYDYYEVSDGDNDSGDGSASAG